MSPFMKSSGASETPASCANGVQDQYYSDEHNQQHHPRISGHLKPLLRLCGGTFDAGCHVCQKSIRSQKTIRARMANGTIFSMLQHAPA